jgi:hypothetical protein
LLFSGGKTDCEGAREREEVRALRTGWSVTVDVSPVGKRRQRSTRSSDRVRSHHPLVSSWGWAILINWGKRKRKKEKEKKKKRKRKREKEKEKKKKRKSHAREAAVFDK